MAGQSEAVAQFSLVTGADAGTASFYLDSAQGNLESAVAAFFEQGGAAEDQGVVEPPAQPASAPPPPQHPAPAQPQLSTGLSLAAISCVLSSVSR